MKHFLLKKFYISAFTLFSKALLCFGCVLVVLQTYAQQGPGGVSTESGGTSNCRVWYDVGTLNLSDNSYADSLFDISPSAIGDHAYQNTTGYEPIYRSDASAGINGQPVLVFNDFQYFKLQASNDINLYEPHNFHTYVFAIRTSDDVESRQIIYEQGGSTKGFNIEIDNHRIYFSAFDKANDGDGSPQFNPISVDDTILTNHNYVYVFEFYGPTGSSGGFMRGFVNGTSFSNSATGVSAVGNHTDDCGLGAINDDVRLHDNTTDDGNTGGRPFIGKLAEFIIYDDTLNDAERIILENYLGAKYGDAVLTNDKYAYEDNYGNEVIGIGRDNSNNYHSISQGRNLFSIIGTATNFDNGEYLFVGHNGDDLTTTSANIPNDESNTKRLAREWRFDHTGDLGPIEFSIAEDELPSLDTGFTKYVLMLDNKAGVASNFTGSNVDVLELAYNGIDTYKATTEIVDGAYVTIGMIKPQALFSYESDYTFEGNSNFSDSVLVVLNYTPATDDTVSYQFIDGTAIKPGDYTGIDSFLIFPEGKSKQYLYFEVIGDTAAENSEQFQIALIEDGSTSEGLGIGYLDTISFSIHDDDNIPEVSFGVSSSSVYESADTVTVDVVRAGSKVDSFTVNVSLKTSGSPGTAILNSDYYFNSTTLSFAPGESVKQVEIIIENDNTDEDNETIYLELSDVQGPADLISPNEFILTILDNDAPPEISFLDRNYFAPETFGEPDISVVLSARSDKTVTVEWERIGGTATEGADFSCGTSGILVFAPGDTLAQLPIYNLQDFDAGEPDETVEFELIDNANLENAFLGSTNQHTFTIKDYTAFEWTGPAGVGDKSEVAMWIDASRESFSHGSQIGEITNFGNTAITLKDNPNGATYQNGGGTLINGRPTFIFDNTNGNDDAYQTPNSGIISGHADNRDFFMVIKTHSDLSTTDVIYEGGGGDNGINICVRNGNLWFYMFSLTRGWGTSPETYLTAPVAPNTEYIIHCKFDQLQTYGGDKMELYINGEKIDGRSDSEITTHNGHEEHHVGKRELSRWGHNGNKVTGSGNYFRGAIAELIVYQNAPINNTRKRLIENYLSAKYNIPIPDSINSTTIPAGFGGEMSGIGMYATGDQHLDAQGYGDVRIKSPTDLDSNEYLIWHSNELSVSDTIMSQLPGCVYSRIAKVWAVNEVGDVGEVDLTIDLTGADISGKTASDYELLVHSDSAGTNFTEASRVTSGRSLNGALLTFAGVDLNNGEFFSVSIHSEDGIRGLWNGEVSNDWHNENNWDCGVPDKNTIVTIPAGTTYSPQIFDGYTGECATITVATGASLIIKPNAALEISK